MSDVGSELAELLDRRKPDGTPVYSDDEVREVIPLLAAGIARGFPDVTFPNFVVETIGDVALEAGIDEKTAPADVWPALERYYESHASPLVGILERMLREAGAQGGLDRARALASVLGVETSVKPLDGGARPEGTVPAGPAARFAALKQTPRK